MIGFIYLLTTVLLWCSWHIVGRVLLDHISPLTILAYRCTFACPVLLAAAYYVDSVGLKLAIKESFLQLFGLGTLLIGGNSLLFILGLKWTSASEAALLQPLITIFNILLPIVSPYLSKRIQQHVQHQTHTRMQKIGIGLCVIGAMWMVASRTTALDSSKTSMTENIQIHRLLGFLCLIGNTLCFSIYTWLQSLLIFDISPAIVTACSYTFVTPLIILMDLFWSYGDETLESFRMNRLDLISLAYVGIFATGIACLLYSYANKLLHPPICGLAAVLQPLVTCIFSFIFLHEQLSLQQIFAAISIISGLVLVLRPNLH